MLEWELLYYPHSWQIDVDSARRRETCVRAGWVLVANSYSQFSLLFMNCTFKPQFYVIPTFRFSMFWCMQRWYLFGFSPIFLYIIVVLYRWLWFTFLSRHDSFTFFFVIFLTYLINSIRLSSVIGLRSQDYSFPIFSSILSLPIQYLLRYLAACLPSCFYAFLHLLLVIAPSNILLILPNDSDFIYNLLRPLYRF